MRYATDVATAQLSKAGEELCGDNVEVLRTGDATTVIMSDGLGSGVKASILSTMTTRIAYGLLRRNVPLETVFETIAGTLPVCQVRGLAYSTLTILKVYNDGTSHLIEYDNPPAMIFRDRRPLDIPRDDEILGGKKVKTARFQLQPEDIVLVVSDGVIHAGVGGLFKLGLGASGLIRYFPDTSTVSDVKQLAGRIVDLADACYLSNPGDDSTAVVVRLRRHRTVSVLTGPPRDRELDGEVVRRFLSQPASKRVVCGGTTGNIVARELGKEIVTSIKYEDPSVPPTATIEGIDLVTEGILTLNKTWERVNQLLQGQALPDTRDGATLLAQTLWEADTVVFFLGTGVNPAHKNLDQLVHLSYRQDVVKKLAALLRESGKKVDVHLF